MHLTGRRRRRLLVPSVLAAALTLTAAGLATASGAGADTVTAPTAAGDPLQREVDAIRDTGTVGVLADVRASDARQHARAGTAELGTGRPVPWDGRFRIGSATKTFTATVVLQLVGEGRISLDDTVEHWLPGVVRGDGRDGSRITVRQLLQHTSGIPEVEGDIPSLNSASGYEAERLRTYTPEELAALAMRNPSTAAPGTFAYSDTDYILLGMIIKKATGHSWAAEVNSRIIRPLRLADTSTPGASPYVPGPHAHAYRAFGTGTAIDVTRINASAFDASGSIISTSADLGRFFTALVSGRLLAPAQFDEMTTTVPAPELGADYGLGLGTFPLSCGGSYYTHPGGVSGYQTWVAVTPDATRTVVLLATGDGDTSTEAAMIRLVDREMCRGGGK
ncbi:serine hydrolase domain-containing protein [Streptomyces sp. NBC_00448]|uniref:serine hydrolase domain-containing protein n=1 Tax=Streptomyces sp. NBC_00448 TaxID=2903652 RepID=UPI002E2153AD